MRKLNQLLFCALGAWVSLSLAQSVPITRFHQVAPGIYRGARPDEDGFKALEALGVRTDLDLENDGDAVEAESQMAKDAHLEFISEPMSGFWAPQDREVDHILRILNDTSKYPIFVHCQHGEDRTGLIVGLHRVFSQKWAPIRAHNEMLDLGFHTFLVFLNHYFEERTGYEE